jgi:hypothetical protein
VAETVTGLQDALINEASFDITATQALAWINRRWRLMIGRARAYRKTLTVGPTVAATAFYPVPAAIEVFEVTVGGAPYGRGRRGDPYQDSQGSLRWSGTGLFVPDATASAVRGITLIPVPDTAGLAITAFAAVEPPDLTPDATGDTLLATILDGEFVEPLIAGAMATGYRREGNLGLARDNDAMFDAGCDEFLRITRRRFRGPGPTQIRTT